MVCWLASRTGPHGSRAAQAPARRRGGRPLRRRSRSVLRLRRESCSSMFGTKGVSFVGAPAFNSVGWFEFGTDQADEVKKFYGELFDWSFTLNTNLEGVTYWEVATPGSEQA